MDPGTRACVAYVVGCVILGSASHQVFDKARGLHIQMKGSIQGTTVEILDYERNCKCMGTLPTLFEFGTNTPITLEIRGRSFFGRDRKSDQFFGGAVEGGEVKVHDYRDAKDYFYTL